LCPKSVLDAFVASLIEHAKTFWPDGSLKSSSISRIVSNSHFSRLSSILERTKAKIVYGGGKDLEGTIDPAGRKRGLEMTIFVLDKEHSADDALMNEEIFGPFLPILPVEDVDEAINFVRARDHPLVLYAFTRNDETKNKILSKTASGNAVFNDTVQQLAVNELPFGGVGESGYGRQVLRYSFDLFTYERAVIDVPKEAEPFLDIRYAPYTPEKLEPLSAAARMVIPTVDEI